MYQLSYEYPRVRLVLQPLETIECEAATEYLRSGRAWNPAIRVAATSDRYDQ